MVDVKVPEEYDVPLEVAFEYLNDYTHFTEFMFGLNFLKPLTEQTSGVGATFDGGMTLGPITLHSTVEVIEWKPNELIVLDSIKGFDVDFRFRFSARGEEKTHVDTLATYRLPFGIAGKILGKTIQPFVELAVKHSVSNVHRLLPAYYAERRESA